MDKRSKKEESLITRQKLIDAGFQHFFKIGFEAATLEKISQEANVSRGAAYWHFKNKKALFEEAVKESLDRIVRRKQPIFEDSDLTFEEKVVKIITVPYQDAIYYQFLQQANQTLKSSEDFRYLREEIHERKKILYHFFLNGFDNLAKEQGNGNNPELLANLLYTYFEGMHSSNTPEEIKNGYTPEAIQENIHFLFQAFMQ